MVIRCFCLTLLFGLVLIITGCGDGKPRQAYSSKPVKAAGTSPITISINRDKVDMSLDINYYLGPPPKNYQAKLICGKLKNDKLVDAVQGEAVWPKGKTSTQVQMDGVITSDSDLCQFYIVDGRPPVIIFLNKDLEAKFGKNFKPLENVRPN